MKTVRFLEEAQDEFFEQISYYQERQKGLGDRFRQSVETAPALAGAHPKLGSPWNLHTRRVFPKGFPFSVVYRNRTRGTGRLCGCPLQAPTNLFAPPKVTQHLLLEQSRLRLLSPTAQRRH